MRIDEISVDVKRSVWATIALLILFVMSVSSSITDIEPLTNEERSFIDKHADGCLPRSAFDDFLDGNGQEQKAVETASLVDCERFSALNGRNALIVNAEIENETAIEQSTLLFFVLVALVWCRKKVIRFLCSTLKRFMSAVSLVLKSASRTPPKKRIYLVRFLCGLGLLFIAILKSIWGDEFSFGLVLGDAGIVVMLVFWTGAALVVSQALKLWTNLDAWLAGDKQD